MANMTAAFIVGGLAPRAERLDGAVEAALQAFGSRPLLNLEKVSGDLLVNHLCARLETRRRFHTGGGFFMP